MESFPISQIAASRYPALELISLAQLAPEIARENLRSLLLADPNYFHNVTPDSLKMVLGIQADSTYECVGRIGYYQQLRQLHARVLVRQARGYSNGDGNYGSKEFVRFYLSCNGGESWRDQGLSVIHVSDNLGPGPLEYAVSVSVKPGDGPIPSQARCLVRAILSWNAPPPPDSPAWIPIWGNVEEVQASKSSTRRTQMNSGYEKFSAEDRPEMIPAKQTCEFRQVSWS